MSFYEILAISVPVILLIVLIMEKKIPFFKGNPTLAFGAAGLVALLIGGNFNVVSWPGAWFKQYDTIAFATWVIIVGALFSNLVTVSGGINTVVKILRAWFGKSPEGLVFVALLALFFVGSMIGTVVAIAAVVGILVIPAFNDMKMPSTLSIAIIVSGASMGSIMPPVSNAMIQAISYSGLETNAVAYTILYIAIPIGFIVGCIAFCKFFVGKKYTLDPKLIPQESASEIFKAEWTKLIPFAALLVVILCASLPSIKWDLPGKLIALIPCGDTNLLAAWGKIPILGKFTNYIVLDLLFACLVTIACSKECRKDLWKIVKKSIKGCLPTVILSMVMGFFVMGYTQGGQVSIISAFCQTLSGTTAKLVGAFLILLLGAVTGSQANSVALLVPTLTPVFLGLGISEAHLLAALACLAYSGQLLPPNDVNVYNIYGIFEPMLTEGKVEAQKVMLYGLPFSVYLAIVGTMFLFV